MLPWGHSAGALRPVCAPAECPQGNMLDFVGGSKKAIKALHQLVCLLQEVSNYFRMIGIALSNGKDVCVPAGGLHVLRGQMVTVRTQTLLSFCLMNELRKESL